MSGLPSPSSECVTNRLPSVEAPFPTRKVLHAPAGGATHANCEGRWQIVRGTRHRMPAVLRIPKQSEESGGAWTTPTVLEGHPGLCPFTLVRAQGRLTQILRGTRHKDASKRLETIRRDALKYVASDVLFVPTSVRSSAATAADVASDVIWSCFFGPMARGEG